VQGAGHDAVAEALVRGAEVDDQGAVPDGRAGLRRLVAVNPGTRVRARRSSTVRRTMRRVCVIVAVLATALAGATAQAGAPGAGVLVPGTSLGGVRLGMTVPQVEGVWGRAYGRCRSCVRPTLYFNMYAFRPEGAGVELRGSRVSAVFTLWAPGAWETKNGLRIGDSAAQATALFGPLPRRPCRGYEALTLRSRRAVTAVYLVDGDVWGFGLLDRAAPVCR
jgi:hypothetical protein